MAVEGRGAWSGGNVGFGARHKLVPKFCSLLTGWPRAGEGLFSSAITVSCSVEIAPCQLIEMIQKEKNRTVLLRKYGPWTSNPSITLDLIRITNYWLQPRPTEWESLIVYDLMSPSGEYDDLRTTEIGKAPGMKSKYKHGNYLCKHAPSLYAVFSCFSYSPSTFSSLEYIHIAFYLLCYKVRRAEGRAWAEAGLPQSDSHLGDLNTHLLMLCKSPRLLLNATPWGPYFSKPIRETP